MSYISPEAVVAALRRMREYHEVQDKIHAQFGIDFTANRGRRNIVMSQAQEAFFAAEIGRTYEGVRSDGRTGESDIYVGEIDRELECKITTPLVSTGAIQFQTDYATLTQKGELDYLYVIACPEFEAFCVLHFEGLTTSDFRVPASGSRGRAAMIKHFGMLKCNVLHGSVVNLSDERAQRLVQSLEDITSEELKALKENGSLLETLKEHLRADTDPRDGSKMKSKRRCALRKRIRNAENRPEYLKNMFNKRRKRVRSDIAAARNQPGRFTFVLEPLPEE